MLWSFIRRILDLNSQWTKTRNYATTCSMWLQYRVCACVHMHVKQLPITLQFICLPGKHTDAHISSTTHMCTHTRRKWSDRKLIWLTLPRQSKCEPGSISAALQSSGRLASRLSTALLPDIFRTTPRLKPQLSVLMQEWARQFSFRGWIYTQERFHLTFHNCLDGEYQITNCMVSHFWDYLDDQICATKAWESLVSG